MLTGWAADLASTIDWLCKLRVFVLFVSRNIAAWLILLAAVDRWLLSSVNARRRQLSTLRNAWRAILITTIVSVIIYGPIFYCYQANLTNAPLKCYGKTEACRLSNDLSFACLTIILPIMLMFLFGMMTIINIRQTKSRVQASTAIQLNTMSSALATGATGQTSKKKFDRRLFLMLVTQILLLTLFTLPQAIQKLYSTLISNQTQSALRTAIDNFLFNLVLLLAYVAHGMTFYIYTLSGGSVFRSALKDLIQGIARRIARIF